MREQLVTVALIETREVRFVEYNVSSTGAIEPGRRKNWDPTPFQQDESGRRLFEEIGRKLSEFIGPDRENTDAVLISLPGTLAGTDTIISSSRLGIRKRFEAARFLSDQLHCHCKLFHDVECLALGERSHETSSTGADLDDSCFVYVFVDEGVGSKIVINGSTYVGAGVAGVLGRLIVQPDGAYNKELRSNGALEVFSSRPWVSERLVATYLSEKDKSGAPNGEFEESSFRKALRTAARTDWGSLPYERIAEGIRGNDPIARITLGVAAKYLGLALNSLIAILSPHRVVLGGGMIDELPDFYDLVVEHARQYSWPNVWNQTQLSKSLLGREAQYLGAVQLWLRSSRK